MPVILIVMKQTVKIGMAMHICYPSPQEAETGGSHI